MWPLIEDVLNRHGGVSQVAKRAMEWSSKRTMEGHGIRESPREGHSDFTVVVDRKLRQGASDPGRGSRLGCIRQRLTSSILTSQLLATAPHRGIYSVLHVSHLIPTVDANETPAVPWCGP